MTEIPAIEEYKICSNAAEHLNTINLGVGSIILGGSITATGLVLQRITPTRFWMLWALLGFSAIFLVGWLLYVHRSVGIQQIYFARMRQIEEQNPNLNLFLQQNLDYATKSKHGWYWKYTENGWGRDRLPLFRSYHVTLAIVISYLALLAALAALMTMGTLTL